jgi:hypothetical protein
MLKYRTVLLLLCFSLAATAGGLVLTDGVRWLNRPPAAIPHKMSLFSTVPPSPRGSTNIERSQFVAQQLLRQQSVHQRLAAAAKVQAAGDLLDAQDKYLLILLSIDPNSKGALQGLVAIRRQLSHDDPAALRRDADTYRRAMLDRTQTQQHYSPLALQILTDTSLTAAREIELDRSRPVSGGAARNTEPHAPSKHVNSTKGRADVKPMVLRPGGTSKEGGRPHIDGPTEESNKAGQHP